MTFTRPEWPNGATCAVTLTFDNFGESFDLLRYGHAGGANADGVYAPRRGVERVLDLLSRKNIPGTFYLEGWNVAKYPDLAREIVARGNEVAAHGWMHEPWSQLEPDVEEDLIKRTTETIAEVIGERPKGWRSPSGLTTEKTLSLLDAAGYFYDSSMGDDDIPYILATGEGDREIIELPWSWPLDDAVYFAHPGSIRRPNDVIDMWIEEFDAACELTGTLMIVCHPRYIGRPSRILALERLIDYIQQREDVWFARCDEVAAVVQKADWAPHHAAPAVRQETD
jgi:peptidoglycan/xylan/chitin deacetylase (PgdA/CDA1 family)